jgi:PKD repeat protein
VTDDDGATSTTTQQVDVSAGNNPPSASFSFSPSGPAADEEVTFDASGTTDDGSISGYQWDWTNDGTTDDTGQQAQHRYSSSGTYDVKLTVKDDDGATDTTTQTVTVQTTGLSAIEGSPNRAFDDANGNGRLDNGETTYSKGQIADFDDESANLVIPENIKKINKNQIEIEAASVNSEADLVSKSGDVQVEASGDIRLRGEVQAQNGNVELSGNRIDTSGVSIRSSTGNVEITASSVFDASDGRLDSQNGDVELISDGDMTLSGATVSSGTGSLSAELGGPNTLYVSGTTIQEPNGDGVLRYSPGSVVEAPDRSEVGPR